MNTLISLGDLGDFFRKFRYKGKKILGRLSSSRKQKVIGTWDLTEVTPSNWWNIPAIRKRWDEKITSKPDLTYYQWIETNFLHGKSGLHMVSPGCGTGSHERHFASCKEIDSILAFDISANSIHEARQENLPKIDYQVKDFYQWLEEDSRCDLLFFYSSLHHFFNLKSLIPALKKKLNPGGLLIIHEYVGPDRMMWTRTQRQEVNRLLDKIPAGYRRFAHGTGIKTRAYRPGLWRTLLTDPSESIESSRILPLIHEHFTPLCERGFGGNILHLLFKDIAHHFIEDTPETKKLLSMLFEAEDEFLKKFPSDFHFGVYTAK